MLLHSDNLFSFDSGTFLDISFFLVPFSGASADVGENFPFYLLLQFSFIFLFLFLYVQCCEQFPQSVLCTHVGLCPIYCVNCL